MNVIKQSNSASLLPETRKTIVSQHKTKLTSIHRRNSCTEDTEYYFSTQEFPCTRMQHKQSTLNPSRCLNQCCQLGPEIPAQWPPKISPTNEQSFYTVCQKNVHGFTSYNWPKLNVPSKFFRCYKGYEICHKTHIALSITS